MGLRIALIHKDEAGSLEFHLHSYAWIRRKRVEGKKLPF
jgi:hypothetical protein